MFLLLTLNMQLPAGLPIGIMMQIMLTVLRAHQFFLYAESEVTVLIVILIIKVYFSGKNIIFDLSNHSKSHDFQNTGDPAKSPLNCKH